MQSVIKRGMVRSAVARVFCQQYGVMRISSSCNVPALLPRGSEPALALRRWCLIVDCLDDMWMNDFYRGLVLESGSQHVCQLVACFTLHTLVPQISCVLSCGQYTISCVTTTCPWCDDQLH